MRRAWKVRCSVLRVSASRSSSGILRGRAAAAARRTSSASWVVVSRYWPCKAVASATASGSSALSTSKSRSCGRDSDSSSIEAGVPRSGSRRRSSGPSVLKLKPRAGLSICIDDTPRSARTKSKPPPASGSSWSRSAKFCRFTIKVAASKPSARSRASVRGSSSESTSTPNRRPPGSTRRSSSCAWPPKPSVASKPTSPGRGSRTCRISATQIGRCMPAGVCPRAITLCSSAAWCAGSSSLYFSSKRRGCVPT